MPLLGIFPNDYRDTWTFKFIVALFTVLRKWNQPMYINWLMNNENMLHIHNTILVVMKFPGKYIELGKKSIPSEDTHAPNINDTYSLSY